MPVLIPDTDPIDVQIQKQREREGGQNNPGKPIAAPVRAEAHTPVYKMHRYFARRPYNVFEHLIKHYSRPGDIILDPFCGGGVTVVEALRARRKVIGVDLNPMATFITRAEVMPVDLDRLQAAFEAVEREARDAIEALYYTRCARCGHGQAIAEWYEWSNVVVCPNSLCREKLVLKQVKKLRAGVYECPACRTHIPVIEAERRDDVLTQVKFECGRCGEQAVKPADDLDAKRYRRIARNYADIVKTERLNIPPDGLPDGDLQRDHSLFSKGTRHFVDLFTRRNLVALARLKKAILKGKFESDIQDMLLLAFSSTLNWASKMSYLKKSESVGWGSHGYWMPFEPTENNIWRKFADRFKAALKGKEYSQKEIGDFCRFAASAADLENASCLLLTQSSDQLPLPAASVDVIITDPPFGGNVQYAELADFWAVWLKERLGLKGLIDNAQEAIQTRHTGFPTEKSAQHYEEMLYRVFKECRRALKPHGWLVMTFHNRDIGVWMALHRAANRAGFKLPPREVDPNRGMLYQPPIEEYTTTLHQRAAGSMLGDFILSFQRQDISPDLEQIKEALTPDEEADLLRRVREIVNYHGGADENLLMTGLLPFLNERNLLHRLARFDFRAFFDAHLIRQGKAWYTEEQIDLQTRALKPLDFVPAEKVTTDIIYAYLKEHRYATIDQLLNLVYTTLVNAHRPGLETIHAVLNRIADLGEVAGQKRPVYYLKPQAAREPPPEAAAVVQKSLFDEDSLVSRLEHNEIILRLARRALERGYKVHVGETEQRKDLALRNISQPMLSGSDYGLPPVVFDTIKEIDLLVLKDGLIVAAFEVATSVDTANKAINDRYRNLFAAAPILNIPKYVVVRDQDFVKASNILYTPANERENFSALVRIVRVSQLTETGMEQLF